MILTGKLIWTQITQYWVQCTYQPSLNNMYKPKLLLQYFQIIFFGFFQQFWATQAKILFSSVKVWGPVCCSGCSEGLLVYGCTYLISVETCLLSQFVIKQILKLVFLGCWFSVVPSLCHTTHWFIWWEVPLMHFCTRSADVISRIAGISRERVQDKELTSNRIKRLSCQRFSANILNAQLFWLYCRVWIKYQQRREMMSRNTYRR